MTKRGSTVPGRNRGDADEEVPDLIGVMQNILKIQKQMRAAQFVCRMTIVALVMTQSEPERVIGILRHLAETPEEAANGMLDESELNLASEGARDLADQIVAEMRLH